MTLWRQYATAEELARYDELERATKANNQERKAIRSRCLTRAWRQK